MSIKPWIEAMRLRTLPVSVAGVLAGLACALAYGAIRPAPFVICLCFAIVAQIVSNFANEYYDYKNGLDKKGREGFRRGVTEGDISPRAMKRATYALLAADCLLGCTLIIWGGWWLIAVGVLIAVFAIAYSTGPFPLSHRGLGDVAVVIFFGIVPVMFTSYLCGGTWENWRLSLPVGFAIGLLAANVLIVNNYRDVDDDRMVGKYTTVVIFGKKIMALIYAINFSLAVTTLALFSLTFASPWWLFGWAVTEILYIFVWIKMIRSEGAALNKVLKFTALLMLLSCGLLLIASSVPDSDFNILY